MKRNRTKLELTRTTMSALTTRQLAHVAGASNHCCDDDGLPVVHTCGNVVTRACAFFSDLCAF